VGFHKLGHLALEPDTYLSAKHLARPISGDNRRTSDPLEVWSFGKLRDQANIPLAKMWSRAVRRVPSPLVTVLNIIAHKFHCLNVEKVVPDFYPVQNCLDLSPCHLSFSLAEQSEGEAGLRKLGIPVGEKFICLVVNDGSHYGKHWVDYETELDRGLRVLTFPINDFVLAAETLAESGYWVVRMGASAHEKLVPVHHRVIDYANSRLRNSFLDIYLAANCIFTFSTQTGPDSVSLAFRKNVTYVDVARYKYFFYDVKFAHWVPARLFSMEMNRSLSLSEIFEFGIAQFKTPDEFARAGLTVLRSTPTELMEYALEAVSRHEGRLQLSPSDLALQNRFVGTFESNTHLFGMSQRGSHSSLVSPNFLRKYGKDYLK